MGMFLSCFENCAHNMAVLERISYRRGERDAYMDTIAVVIHGPDTWNEGVRNEGVRNEEGEDSEMIHDAPRSNQKTVRFRRLSGSEHDYDGDAEHN
jgi:hypothetical protein